MKARPWTILLNLSPLQLLAFGLALALLGLNMLFSASSINRLSTIHDELLKDGQITRELRNTMLGLQNIEIGLRTYVTSGSEAALEPYQLGRRQTIEHFERLSSFTYSELLRNSLPSIKTQIYAQLDQSDKSLKLYRQTHQQASLLMNESHNRGESLRILLNQLLESQTERVDAAKRRYTEASSQTTFNLIVASATSVGLLLAVMMVISRGIARHRSSEQFIRAAEARRTAILENIADGVLGIDQNLCVIESNPSAAQMLGYENHELTGLPIKKLLVPVHTQAQLASALSWEETLWQPLLSHLGERLEIELRHRSGKLFSAEIGLARVSGQELYTLTLRDITRRIQREQELIQARAGAEAASRAKSEFLANMSHELRTPLNIILGYSEIVIENLEQRSLQEVQSDLAKIQGAGHHLLAMIGDILDVSKIEAGKMVLRPSHFEPVELVRELYGQVRPLMQTRQNALLIDCASDLGTIYTDRTRLYQCLLNLLSNAAKFTREGKVTLSVHRLHSDKDELIQFKVIDTGIGIDPEQIENLFEAFTQADTSSTRKEGGTGLGLALSRQLSRLLGGDLIATSQLGEGSVFTLTIPVGPAQFEDTQSDNTQSEVVAESN